MSKKVIIAKSHGFCFGVERAINLAKKTSQKYPQKTYILGEIVHNRFVVSDLEKNYGVKTVESLDQIPQNCVVVIRAHGVSPAIYQKALEKNLEIVDATCPMVAQVHTQVKKLALENKQIIYIASDLNHDEAIGVFGEAPQNIILTTLKDIYELNISDPKNSVVLTQTTLSINETKLVFEFLKQKYPDLNIQPHICQATTERQNDVIKIANESDINIIVGSLNSSNSKRLLETALSVGKKAYIVETAADLQGEWFQNTRVIGVSSGASTPENLLEEVVKKIKNYD
jgi:4-hydroxy-3-methylbut-2-en-1-yl diphosphate reductase